MESVVGKKHAVRGQTPAALFSLAMSLLKPVEPALLDAPVSRDPDDDHVIACAIGANANMIVTGDKDLLVLGQFQGIAILSASQAIAQLAK